MSLLVWMPLTGDLTNNGAANVTITNNGATVATTDGKIGSCYYFNGSSQIKISLPPTMTTIKNTSVCAFIKSTGTVVALGGISQNQANNHACMTLYTSGWQFTGSSAYKYVSGGTIANTSVWHHVCCVMTDTNIITYLDGNQVANVTIASVGVTNFDLSSVHFIEIGQDSPGGDERLTGYVNDFRVYDHALSAKEVKEISQGLILHLPLNDLIGNDNLLKNSTQGIGISQTAYNLQDYNFSKALVAGTTYTITCKINMSDEKKAFAVYHSGGSIMCGPWIANTGSGVYTWSFAATSQMASQTSGGGHGYARVYVSNNNGPQGSTALSGTANVDWIKIEEGTVSTGFIPNSADALYNTLGLNSGIVHDISGYVHNGTMSTTRPTVFTDSARYSAAMTFANGVYVSIPIPSATVFGSSYTFSWWGKCTAYEGKMYWGFSNGNKLNLYGYKGNYYWNTGDGSSNPFSGATFADQIDNEWHHFAVTGDGAAVKLYIDGEFKANASAFKAITGTNIILNGWDTSNSYNFNGQLSDFRLYATALSADDIMDLYNKPVSIDNTGKVHAIEYREV